MAGSKFFVRADLSYCIEKNFELKTYEIEVIFIKLIKITIKLNRENQKKLIIQLSGR